MSWSIKQITKTKSEGSYYDVENRLLYYGTWINNKLHGIIHVENFKSFEGSECWTHDDDIPFEYYRYNFSRVYIYRNGKKICNFSDYEFWNKDPFFYRFIQKSYTFPDIYEYILMAYLVYNNLRDGALMDEGYEEHSLFVEKYINLLDPHGKKIRYTYIGGKILYFWSVKAFGKKFIRGNCYPERNIMAKALGMYSRNYEFMKDPERMSVTVCMDGEVIQYELFRPSDLKNIMNHYEKFVNKINNFFGKNVAKYHINNKA